MLRAPLRFSSAFRLMKGCRNRFVWTRPDSAGSGLKNSKQRSCSPCRRTMTSDSADVFRAGSYPVLKMHSTCLRSMPRLAADDRASDGLLSPGFVAAPGPCAAPGWFGVFKRTMRAGARSVLRWVPTRLARDGSRNRAWWFVCGCLPCRWRTRHEFTARPHNHESRAHRHQMRP